MKQIITISAILVSILAVEVNGFVVTSKAPGASPCLLASTLRLEGSHNTPLNAAASVYERLQRGKSANGAEDVRGQRRPLRRFWQLKKAGTASIQQRLHSTAGVASLLLGSLHFAHVMINGFSSPISQREIIGAGSIHVVTALMGIPRINWKSRKESARNAMIWPVPLQNAWLVASALTEWSQRHGNVFSLRSSTYIAFTIANVFVALWQTYKAYVSGGINESERQKTGIWFQRPSVNALVAFSSYTGIFLMYCLQALFMGQFVDPSRQCGFLATHPEYANVVSNTLVNTAFLNNFAIFGATLIKYKVITPRQMRLLYLPVSVASGMAVLLSLLHADSGSVATDLITHLREAL